ncbi:hypothetical protein P879_06327 [Paragonimus westermani]|uniref:Centromere protein S n=1 Tax=Paragonimus westermani TaxID=34504 RepID=A0A8T0DLY9_9TREM|nr:hypothetical protein P879_06327 [Paragonimus westermani]
MASRTDGIQLLLQAEKSASDKVNEAKRRKAKRLKEAKVEAQTEIDAERSERERHFKMCEERVLGRRSEIEAQIQKLTDEIIENQAASVNLHKEEAINLLLRLVMDIQPRLHQNYRIGAAEHKAELHYVCTKLAEEIAKKQGCTIGLDIVCLVTELLFRFYQVLATDLECFAKHARRTTVNVDDVLCFVRRNPQLLNILSDHHKQQTVRKKVSLPSFVGSSRSKAKVTKAPDCKPDGPEKLAICTPDSSCSLTEWFNTND